MANPIQNISGAPDLGPSLSALASPGGVSASANGKTSAKAAVTPVQDSSQAKAPTPQVNSADLRLVIEDDKAAGCFVYKVINRTTGEVVQQAPQEQIVKLRESDGYLAGDVIKAQA